MSRIGCFSRPQIPLLPTIPTTSAPKRTRVSRSPRENPSAPSPHITTTWRPGCASAAAIADHDRVAVEAAAELAVDACRPDRRRVGLQVVHLAGPACVLLFA